VDKVHEAHNLKCIGFGFVASV